jgi:anaerobic ribonucleoside-triphosphate reductase activating protein
VVWVQGCSLGCPGCWNPQAHTFDAGEEIDPTELASRVVREAPAGTEGVTLSGGEPMQQALSVYHFITMIHALRPDWSIGMFTGYTLTEMFAGSFDVQNDAMLDTYPQIRRDAIRMSLWSHQIRPHLDFAVTGRYNRKQLTMRADLPYRHAVSSANQHIELFWRGDRFRYQYSDFPPLQVEVKLSPRNGLAFITGFPMKGTRHDTV